MSKANKLDCKNQKFKLISGNRMPFIGFGTFQIRGRSLIKEVINWALAAGYRAFDTAAVYGNEVDIGLAFKELLPKYHLKREDIFITSKLSPSDHGDRAARALRSSISFLDCGYLDLYLIHWPGASRVPIDSHENIALRAFSWEVLVKAQQEGLVRDIGVSNYTVRHLTELLDNYFGVKPAVNQVEWHPHNHESALKVLCDREGILLQAYSSLGGSNNESLVADPAIIEISGKYNKSPAQILLRWALQQHVAIIPKGRSKEHIDANIDLDFIICPNEMNIINNLKNHKSEKYAWDPNYVK